MFRCDRDAEIGRKSHRRMCAQRTVGTESVGETVAEKGIVRLFLYAVYGDMAERVAGKRTRKIYSERAHGPECGTGLCSDGDCGEGLGKVQRRNQYRRKNGRRVRRQIESEGQFYRFFIGKTAMGSRPRRIV